MTEPLAEAVVTDALETVASETTESNTDDEVKVEAATAPDEVRAGEEAETSAEEVEATTEEVAVEAAVGDEVSVGEVMAAE
jgi:hypothetical protein